MWLLAIPIAIVLVIWLLFATVATVFGILADAWPLVLILAGVWLIVRSDRGPRSLRKPKKTERRERERRARADSREERRYAPVAVVTEPEPERAPVLPLDVQVKVEHVKRKVAALLEEEDRFPAFSQDLFLVRQTAGDYLPRTLETYLALPRGAADKPLVPGGKTAHEELKEQLDLLDAKLEEIADNLHRRDLDKLVANRRFLEARFDSREEMAAPVPARVEGKPGAA